MRFNVSRAFDIILDGNVLLFRRAVTLYELQVAVLSCRGLVSGSSKKSGGFVINADSRLLRSARVLSTLQLLQHAASLHDKEIVREELKILQLIVDKDVRELIWDVVFGKIGLERVRYALLPREFAAQIKQLNMEATCVVALTDFSLKFMPIAGRPRKKGGVTQALDTVYLDQELNSEPIYRLERGKDSVRNYARRLKPVTALLWLFDSVQGFLPPPHIPTKSFPSKLLSLTRCEVSLRRIAASYGCVAGRLRHRGYACPPLQLKRPEQPQTVAFEPLAEQLRVLI